MAKRLKFQRNEIIWAWVFLTPMIVGFILFFLFPFVHALIISFSEYNLFDPPKLIGFANFAAIFTDTFFLRSLLNALLNAVGVPIGIFVALLLSNMLVSIKRGSLFFRTVFFLPTICGAVAITFIWQWMYAPSYGLLVNFLRMFGADTTKINFLSSKNFMASMIFMGVWSGLGTSILLFFASLKNSPQNLYEAAEIDGAGPVSKFIHITLPVISPVTFYILITGLSGSFQEFTRFQVMRGGSYNEWSIMPVWWIYNHTGKFGYQYGYASALGLFLGVIILAIAGINFVVSKKWVNYDS